MFGVNIIDFFDIFFDDTYVLSRSSLTDSYDDSIIFQTDKVCYGIWIGFLKIPINVDNKKVSLI